MTQSQRASAAPAPLRPERVAFALLRAAIPVIGVTWFGWPMANVLFFFFLELVLAALDGAIAIARPERGERLDRNAASWIVFAIILCEVPVFMLGSLLIEGRDLGDKLTAVRAMLEVPGAWLALAAQVALALLTSVLVRRSEAEVDEAGHILGMRLAMLILILTAVGLMGIAIAVATSQSADALLQRVTVYALVASWAFVEVDPPRASRLLTRIAGRHGKPSSDA